MKWTKYMEMDIGFKTKPNQMTRWKCMLDQTTHWRSSRNWNGILCDFNFLLGYSFVNVYLAWVWKLPRNA